MRETVLSKIMAIKNRPLKELQAEYEKLFDGKKPPTSHRVYIWKRIAFRIQELAYGGISDEARDKLNALIQEHDPINHKTHTTILETHRRKEGRDRRLPIPGTILTKEYKKTKYEVKALEKGFEFNNTVYKSLTAIAKEITGAHWNGFLFFGL